VAGRDVEGGGGQGHPPRHFSFCRA
jgi:hypothetical protein